MTGIFLRFLYLDADPHYSEWVGFITDEGRWIRHGRSLALHGNLTDGRNLHFFMAPLFQLSNYLVFELVGVKMLTSRMLTALCGSAILILFWGTLRQAITPQALLLGLTLLAFQADLVVLSRIAVPEMAVMFFQLVIYFMIVSSDRSFWRLVAAGMLTASAVAVKLTMLLFLPICFVIIFAMPRNIAGSEGRWRDLRLFGMGLTVPVLVVGLVWYFFLEKTLTLGNAIESLSTAITFLGLSSPYAVISFPFDHTLSLTFNLWALGLWLSVLGWSAGHRDKIDFRSHRYLATSAIWFTLYLLLMLTLEYFPSRYKIHILLPMALFIAVGISLLQRLGIRKVIESFAGMKGPSGLLWLGVVSLPTAALLSPLLVPAVALAGVEPERLIGKLSSLSLSLVASMCILYQFKQNQQAVRFFLFFPIVGGIGWLLLSTTSSGYSFWPTVGSQTHIVSWSLILLVASAISVSLGWITGWWGSTSGARLVTISAMFYLTISLVRIAPGYLNPHYSIRDTSRDLGALLSGPHTIASLGADGLFNENNLPYESLTAPEFNLLGERPEILVVAFADKWVKNILEQEYYPMKTYDLYMASAYDGIGRIPVSLSRGAGFVTVYKKNATSQK